jgi:hypothetical protein
MLSYSEARQLFIDGLTRDVIAHESGRFKEVGAGFDHLDAELPRDEGSEFEKLFIALNFWDGWVDARNHEWKYYKGIDQSDWPRLAKRIVAALSEDREISDPMVLEHFDFRQRDLSKGSLTRLLDHIRK